MILKCPDCGRKFFLEIKFLVMLNESIKRNPKLKIICSACGWKLVYKNKKEHKYV